MHNVFASRHKFHNGYLNGSRGALNIRSFTTMMSSEAYRDRITSRFYTQAHKMQKYTVYRLRNSGGIK
jgi:hypothetical protein